jgi:hypothetical protein
MTVEWRMLAVRHSTRPSGRGSALLVWRDDREAIAEERGFPR